MSGQSATAVLSGTATDEQGAVVSNAAVKIAVAAKYFERTITANGKGYFIFTQLAPIDDRNPESKLSCRACRRNRISDF